MKFDYKDPNELDSFTLAEGAGSFIIKSVYDTDKNGHPMADKNGHDMVKLDLTVTDNNRHHSNLFVYLTGSMPWKIKQLVDSIGYPQLYSKDGNLNTKTLVGKSGKCVIYTEPARPPYKARSAIKEFLKSDKAEDAKTVPDSFDDLPF